MNKIIIVYFIVVMLRFLCKINLNVFFCSKNKIFKKILFQYYLILFFKNKFKFFLNFNFYSLLSFKINSIFFKNNFIFNKIFFLKYLKNVYIINYSFLFLNQGLSKLLNNSGFNKNIFISLNKNSIYYYNCLNAFLINKFIFYKFLNEDFFSLIFKNFRKLLRQSNSVKSGKKNFFLSKINFFKLNNFDKKIKYFNNNTMFYFFLLKKNKVDFTFSEKLFSFNKNAWIFYSNIYVYNFKKKFNFNLNKFNFNLNVIKFFDMHIPFFYNVYFNFIISEINVVDIFTKKSNIIIKDKFKINLNFFFIKFFYKIFFFKINTLFLIKPYLSLKINNIYSNKFKNLQNYLLYTHVIKSLIILNDSQFDFNYHNFSNLYSNFYLFNLLNNLVTNQNELVFENNFNHIKNSYYNNHYPVLFFKNSFINVFFKKVKENSKSSVLKYVQFYLIGFFEYLFKKRIFIKTLNNSQLDYFYKERLEFLFDEYKFFQLKIIKGLNVSEILEVIWLSFQNKDVFLFMNWLKKRMEKIHFKNHKKFLNLLKLIMIKYSHIFLESFRLKGFFFDIRGKVGVGGNSKKRHFFFRIGKINLSSKNSKLDHQQNIVNTSFGALGVTMILSY